MLFKRVDLYEYFGLTRPEKGAGYLDCYVATPSVSYPARIRPAMLVIAGGGYQGVSDREKECIAFTFLAEGFCAFALEYSVSPVHYPAQLIEGCMAMAYIRENAAEFRIDENHVGVTGFSAGGHLAAMLAIIYDEKEVKTVLGHKVSLCRPDAAVLAYPVISSGEKAHFGSFDSLCGDDLALKERLSLEKRVTPDSVPAFIWATANDGAVPSENSLMLAAAYKENGVPFELHIFENGVHGLSLATEETGNVNAPVAAWVGLCITWLKSHGFTVCDAIKKREV